MGVPSIVRQLILPHNWDDLSINPYGPDMNDDEGKTLTGRQRITSLGIHRCIRSSAIPTRFE